jgi:hypothetical protein
VLSPIVAEKGNNEKMNGVHAVNANRYRRRTSWILSESSPLEIDNRSGRYSGDYATFSANENAHESSPFWWVLLQFISPGSTSTSRSFHSQRKGKDSPWKFSAGLLISLILIAYTLRRDTGSRSYMNSVSTLNLRPEWEWDRNIYYTVSGEQGTNNNASPSSELQWNSNRNRNLLLVQVAGNPIRNELVDITSRPNRAYAHQWRRDYVRYSNNNTGSGVGVGVVNVKSRTFELDDMTCVDQVTVIHTMMEEQRAREHERESSEGWHVPAQQRVGVSYDVVALLPADAVIRDLDYDLLDLLPDDKLVALAGWKKEDPWAVSGSRINVAFFNLRHRHADRVVQAWSDAVLQSKRVVTCGAGREISILLEAIQSVLESDEELSSMIHPLDQTEQGFVGDISNEFAIKGLAPPPIGSSRAVVSMSSLPDTAVSLQTTADSVCYRYYPKCEVLQ